MTTLSELKTPTKSNSTILYEKPANNASASIVNYYEMYNRCAEYQGELSASNLRSFLEMFYPLDRYKSNQDRLRRVTELYYLNHKHPNWLNVKCSVSAVFDYQAQKTKISYLHFALANAANSCQSYQGLLRKIELLHLELRGQIDKKKHLEEMRKIDGDNIQSLWELVELQKQNAKIIEKQLADSEALKEVYRLSAVELCEGIASLKAANKHWLTIFVAYLKAICASSQS